MNAPLPSSFFSSDSGHTSSVTSRRRARQAAKRVWTAIRELRGTKTSIAKARTWLPACDADVELNLEVRKLFEIEKRLIAIARRLESTAEGE